MTMRRSKDQSDRPVTTERPLQLPATPSSSGSAVALMDESVRLQRDLDLVLNIERNKEYAVEAEQHRLIDEEIGQLWRELNLAPRWAAVDRPATDDEIAACLVLLKDAFPNLHEAPTFGAQLASIITSLSPSPSLYELMWAYRHVLKKCEFLSIAAVIKALKDAQRVTFRICGRTAWRDSKAICRPQSDADARAGFRLSDFTLDEPDGEGEEDGQ
jgi:hypothetical protein